MERDTVFWNSKAVQFMSTITELLKKDNFPKINEECKDLGLVINDKTGQLEDPEGRTYMVKNGELVEIH